jgi:ABC-type dipeptide/oligopeptide/nickel transport system ATPase component
MLPPVIRPLLPRSWIIDLQVTLFPQPDSPTIPTPAQMRAIRGNEIAMIFQDPMTALNPVLTIGKQLRQVLILEANAAAGYPSVAPQKLDNRLTGDAFPATDG